MTNTVVPAWYATLQIPTSIDYQTKDFTGYVAAMQAYAANAFPEWNITGSEGDFGVMMMELFAYCLDINAYYGDRIAQEAYLPTATQRLSILNIAQTLGYLPANGAPSSGFVTLTTANPGPSVRIPPGTQVVSVVPSADGTTAIFETQAEVIIDGDGGSAVVEVLQGETQTMIPIGQSAGTPGQAFALAELGVLDNTVKVYVQDAVGSELWAYVPYLVDSGPEDTVYSLSTDQAGATSVVFGDNVNGLVPGINLQIWATYRVGNGADGNLPPGSVAQMVTDIQGVSVALLADNVTANSSQMTGGANAETIEQIRANAPAAFRAQYRAISPQDYSDLALNVPGVLMSSAVMNHSTSCSLYVMGPGYTAPGPDLIQAILTYFNGKTAGGTTVSVVDPDIVAIDVGSISNPVQLAVKAGYGQDVVKANVKAALESLLTPPAVNFAQLINVSDIYHAVLAVAGVSYCVIPVMSRQDAVQSDTSPIQLRPSEVPSVGVITISATGGV